MGFPSSPSPPPSPLLLPEVGRRLPLLHGKLLFPSWNVKCKNQKTKIHVLPVREGNDEMDPKNGGASIKAKSRKGRPWKGRRTGRSRCMGYGSTMSARGTGGRWVPDAGPCRAPRTGGVVGQRELTEERGRRKQRAQGQELSRARLSRPGPLPGEGNDLAGGMVSAQPRAAPPQRGRRSC